MGHTDFQALFNAVIKIEKILEMSAERDGVGARLCVTWMVEHQAGLTVSTAVYVTELWTKTLFIQHENFAV